VRKDNYLQIENYGRIYDCIINCYRRLFDTFYSHVDHDGSTYILSGTLYGPVYWTRAYKGIQPHGTRFSWSRLLHISRHLPCDDILHGNSYVDIVLHFRFFLVKTRLGVLRQRFQHERQVKIDRHVTCE